MKRILFVDDDASVRSELQTALLRDPRGWQGVFVENGEQALARLESESFSIVVSDMQMPKMDGASLLKRVQARHPNVVRIILASGDELETALRTVSTAHQFLRKPCDLPTLRNVVERASGVQALLGNPAIAAPSAASAGYLPFRGCIWQ